jgi:hypothetical protein
MLPKILENWLSEDVGLAGFQAQKGTPPVSVTEGVDVS